MTENDGRTSSIPKWQESLSEELWMQILSFVPPMEILQSVTRVSKTLHGCTVPHAYWLSHTKALLQDYHHRQCHDHRQVEAHLGLLEHTNLNNHQLQRICLFLSARKKSPPQQDSDVNSESNHHNQHLPACLLHGSRLMTRAGAEAIRQQHYVVTPDQNSGNPNDDHGTTPTATHRRRVCLASSTDNPNELLENVLSGYHDEELLRNLGLFGLPRRQHHTDSKWWSSRASATQETCETLLFVTNCPLALLSELKWRPLLDPFTRRQAYTWRHAIVKAYQLPLDKLDSHPTADNAGFPCTVEALPEGLATQRRRRVNEFGHDDDDMASDSDDEDDDDNNNHINIQSTRQEANALRVLLEGETPVYESPPLPYTLLQSQQQRTLQRNIPWQTLPFPPGILVIANAVTITLVGKDSRQFAHSGFYACVEQVKLEGMPLLKQAQEEEWVAGVSAAGAGVVRHLMGPRRLQGQQEQQQERRLPDPPSDDDEFMDAEYGMDFDEVWNRTGG